MKERIAVVTGGAQGIGYAVAERLLASGARVALWDLDEKLVQQAADDLGNGAVPYAADVADTHAMADLAAQVKRELGPVSVLVNSAGIAGSNAPVIEYNPSEWRRIIEINLTGTFCCD